MRRRMSIDSKNKNLWIFKLFLKFFWYNQNGIVDNYVFCKCGGYSSIRFPNAAYVYTDCHFFRSRDHILPLKSQYIFVSSLYAASIL